MGTVAIERNLYDGVFYCRSCGRPLHVFLIMYAKERCVCGSKGFISSINFDIQETLLQTEVMIEEGGIKIS